MSDQAMQTPLIDLLRSVPETLRGHWASQWNEDGLSTGHSVAPVGMYCHQAADRIKELDAEVIEARRQGMDDGYMRANIENVGDYMLLQEENQLLREGIDLHRTGTKMRAGSLPATPEDVALWALLGGGEK